MDRLNNYLIYTQTFLQFLFTSFRLSLPDVCCEKAQSRAYEVLLIVLNDKKEKKKIKRFYHNKQTDNTKNDNFRLSQAERIKIKTLRWIYVNL